MGSQPLQLSPALFPTPLAESPPLAPPTARVLPPQPSLEQLKKRAKDLLAAARGGDRAAHERLERCFPALRAGQTAAPAGPQPTLSQAQLVIAREHDFPSWTRLRRAVELAPLRGLMERLAERPVVWPLVRGVMQALADAGPAGIEAALEALSHPHPAVRRGAVDFLDHHATDACVPQLTHLALHDADPDVRRRAVHALICEGCKETPLQTDVLPALVEAFRHDPNRRVRFNAALPLSRHADHPVVQAAFRAAVREDPSSLARRAAVGGLRGGDVLPLLAHVAQHDPDPHVRVAAARRLGREPYLQLACEVLEAALREGARRQVKHDAHEALKRLSPEYRQLAAQRAREARWPWTWRSRGSSPPNGRG
jgi:hypothetical protein